MIPTAPLRAAAPSLGLSLLGFARSEPVNPAPFLQWLDEGRAAGMDFLNKRQAERFDPEALLPGARTIVCAAFCFAQALHSEPSGVARHARGRDYHGLVQDRMRRLRRLLLSLDPTVETYTSVDAGPVLEKQWAARAGLGWIGKNSLLLTREHGSRVVLGVMLIDREVDSYDAPQSGLCGDCTACLEACPTRALTGPAMLDARRCLAYELNPHRRSDFSEALRPLAGPYAYGCDACQDCCPWNRAEHACNDPKFAPRPFAKLSLRELAALTPEEHHALLQGSVVARITYDGLRRNALVALAREARLTDDPLVHRLASEESSPQVARIARWILDR